MTFRRFERLKFFRWGGESELHLYNFNAFQEDIKRVLLLLLSKICSGGEVEYEPVIVGTHKKTMPKSIEKS